MKKIILGLALIIISISNASAYRTGVPLNFWVSSNTFAFSMPLSPEETAAAAAVGFVLTEVWFCLPPFDSNTQIGASNLRTILAIAVNTNMPITVVGHAESSEPGNCRDIIRITSAN